MTIVLSCQTVTELTDLLRVSAADKGFRSVPTKERTQGKRPTMDQARRPEQNYRKLMLWLWGEKMGEGRNEFKY